MNKQYIKYLFGAVLVVEGFLLLLSSIVAIVYKENVFGIYLTIGIIECIVGFLLSRKKPNVPNIYAKEGLIIVAFSWIELSIIGAIPFVVTGEIPSFIDALFEVTSGFTTTGSSILSNVEALTRTSLFFRSFTHFVGGMGVLVFVLAVLPTSASGMHVMRAESPGPTVGKFVSKLSNTARILYLIYAFMTFVELVVLMILGLPFYDAINIALETAGTGGFSIYNSSLGSFSAPILITVSIFMILFGINFNVYFLILIKKAKDAFKCEELRVYLGIIVVSIILIAFNINTMYNNIAYSFEHSLFQVASIITTTGFSSVDFDLWPTFSKTILVLLMFCGACAGSTGGGIKVSRIVIMIKDCANSIRQVAHPRTVKVLQFESKPVEKEVVHSIKNYICIYVLIFMLSMLIISIDNFDFTTNFTAVAATLNNIGPGLMKVGPTCNFSGFSSLSKLVLIFDMLAGRLELMPMLVLFSPFIYKHDFKSSFNK